MGTFVTDREARALKESLSFDPDLKLQKGIGERKGINPFHGKISRFDGDLGPMMAKKRGDEILVNYFPTKEEMSEEMRCSVCKEIAAPPAYFCYSGHWICGKDLKHTALCPFGSERKCQKDFLPIRPLFYECIYNYVKPKCMKKENGNSSVVQPKIEKGPIQGVKHNPSNSYAIQILKKKIHLNDQLIKVLDKEGKVTKAEKSSKVETIDQKKFVVKGTPKPGPQFSKYRFDQNDIDFIAKNAERMETMHMMIPSVKKLEIPKEVVKRELRRFQCVVEDSIVMKKHREALD